MSGATTLNTLARKLAEVMGAVKHVPKRGRNTFHNYDYATEADIADAVRELLAARQVVLVPQVNSVSYEPRGDKGEMLTTVTMTISIIDGESGEQINVPWMGSGSDKLDKGLYKAITGGTKYFLLKLLLIPTGDDPEEDKPETATERKPVKAAPSRPSTLGSPVLANGEAPPQPTARKPEPKGHALLDEPLVDLPPTRITEPQRKRLFAMAHSAGWKDAELKQWLVARGYQSSRDITSDVYETLCEQIAAGGGQ
jgi:hypothetical protein